MGRRLGNLARALVVLLTVGMVPAAIALPKAGCNSTIAIGPDGWESIAPPGFSSGEQSLVSYSVDPLQPATIFVSNGTAIQRSTDGGCNFSEVYGSGEGPPSAGSITDVVAAGRGTVYVTTEVSVAGPVGVLVSRDAGATWSSSGRGVLPVGIPIDLATSPASPEVAYLLVEVSATAGVGGKNTVVYATRDAGATWEIASTQLAPLGNAPIDGLEVHPDDATSVWGTGPSGLIVSRDGARTWTPTELSGDVAVAAGGGGGRVAAFSGAEARAFVSDDRGASWDKIWTPVAGDPPSPDDLVQSAAWTPNGGIYVSVSTSSAMVYRLDANGVWIPLTSGELQLRPAFEDLQVRGPGAVPYALTPQAVVRLARVVPNPSLKVFANRPTHSHAVPGAVKCDLAGKPAGGPDALDHRLTPAGETVVLTPGSEETITYTLALAPKPFEVFFLLDTSRSAGQGDIGCSITQGILDVAAELAADRAMDVRVGLGETRQYPRYRPTVGPLGGSPVAAEEEFYAYRLRRRIGAMDQGFVNSATSIEFGAASGANLAALQQAVSGEGQDVTPPGDSEDDIAPGQAAGFDPGSFPVIFHVVDGWFSTPDRTPGYPGPSFAEVQAALRGAGIKHVSLWTNDIHSEKTDPTTEPDRTHDRPGRSAHEDAVTMTSASGALAQNEVDCDGNGYPDVLLNDPLVCPYRGRQTVAAAVENLLRSFEDPQAVALSVDDGAGFVSRVTPAAYDSVDLLRANRLKFDVTFTCDRDQAGQAAHVGLGAVAGGVDVASATTLVECVGMPPPPLPRVQTPVVPALALPPPPPPVQPVTAAAPAQAPVNVPAPQMQPAPANAQASQAQAAAVPQRQVQPQVALVRASNAVQERAAMEYMMVRAHRGADALERARFLVGLGGLGMITAFGIARVRLARSVVRVRR